MPCKHYIVEGRVQGVFYRASTQDTALQIGLQGWVRNLADGRVEAVACGTEQQLATLEAWLKQGPPMARVNRIETQDWTGHADFDDFSVR